MAHVVTNGEVHGVTGCLRSLGIALAHIGRRVAVAAALDEELRSTQRKPFDRRQAVPLHHLL